MKGSRTYSAETECPFIHPSPKLLLLGRHGPRVVVKTEDSQGNPL